MKTYTHNVYLNGKKIDTIFGSDADSEEVYKSLVNHDGRDPAITIRKVWQEVLVIQGNHGMGWEDESEYTTAEEKGRAYHELREYRLACHAPYRLITRKVQV